MTFTHESIVYGCDARTPGGYRARTKLRQTKRYWITPHGRKFHKKTGKGIGDWPMYALNLSSIRLL